MTNGSSRSRLIFDSNELVPLKSSALSPKMSTSVFEKPSTSELFKLDLRSTIFSNLVCFAVVCLHRFREYKLQTVKFEQYSCHSHPFPIPSPLSFKSPTPPKGKHKLENLTASSQSSSRATVVKLGGSYSCSSCRWRRTRLAHPKLTPFSHISLLRFDVLPYLYIDTAP